MLHARQDNIEAIVKATWTLIRWQSLARWPRQRLSPSLEFPEPLALCAHQHLPPPYHRRTFTTQVSCSGLLEGCLSSPEAPRFLRIWAIFSAQPTRPPTESLKNETPRPGAGRVVLLVLVVEFIALSPCPRSSRPLREDLPLHDIALLAPLHRSPTRIRLVRLPILKDGRGEGGARRSSSRSSRLQPTPAKWESLQSKAQRRSVVSYRARRRSSERLGLDADCAIQVQEGLLGSMGIESSHLMQSCDMGTGARQRKPWDGLAVLLL